MIDILIVDHAAEDRRSVRNFLSAGVLTGFNLRFVTDYREILEGFHSKAYDICLIDSASGNGLRLFAQAQSIGWEAPVILITSNDAREVIKAFRSGVADCLTRDHMTQAAIESSICCVVEEAGMTSLQGERERRYLALLDNATEIIYTHDLEGNFTSIDRSAEQLVGYSQEESLNLTVSQIVTAEFRDVVDRMIKQTLDSQSQTFYQIEILTKSGRSLPVEVETHLIYQYGKVVEVQWIAREVGANSWNGASLLQNPFLNVTGKRNTRPRILQNRRLASVA